MPTQHEDSELIGSLLGSRAALVELVVVAVCLATGINLLSSALPSHFALSGRVTIVVGCALVVAPLLYMGVRLFASRVRHVTIDAFFPYDEKNNAVLRVDEYHFAEQLESYLQSAFSENPALKAAWDREPLRDRYLVEPGAIGAKRQTLRSAQLIREAVEYYVLSALSTHLTDYYNDEQFDESELVELEREDVPDVLLRNRFLDLFSRPMEDRPAFLDEGKAKRQTVGEVIAVFGPTGMYERFDLTVPKRSRLRRLSPSSFEIDTPRCVLRCAIHFEGNSASVPFDFATHYLGADRLELTEYEVGITLSVRFRLRALLTPAGWHYFQWIDSFIQNLQRDAAADQFFRRIQWDTVSAILHVARRAGLVHQAARLPDSVDDGLTKS